MKIRLKSFTNSIVFLMIVVVFGCAKPATQPAQEAPPPLSPAFPPQAVMQTGDYKDFYKENSEVLKTCQDPDKCAMALFNLSFLFCYPKSPYFNLRQGLKYIDDLIAAAPESQWASEARVWKALVEKSMRKKVVKRPATAHDGSEKQAEDAQSEKQAEEPQDVQEEIASQKEWVADRQRMEDEIKTKDEIIKKLTRQLERSRQIDIEMEQRERGLLR